MELSVDMKLEIKEINHTYDDNVKLVLIKQIKRSRDVEFPLNG